MPGKPNGIGAEIVSEMLDKFPDAATKTLARKAYEANKEVWSSLETCRSAFRKARGQIGKFIRGRTVDKRHYAPAGHDRRAMPFPKLPEGITHLNDWQAFHIDTPGVWAKFADLHIPYHNTDAVHVAIAEAKRRKPVGILLNGDLMDCFAISRWEKDPRKRDFAREIRTTEQFLEYLRYEFPKARLVWKWGNHEERYDSYMQTKAPELLDIPQFDMANLVGATRLGVEIVKDKRPIKLGKLFGLHGHEYKFAIQNPVNPARGLFLRAQVSAFTDHFHQASSHSEKNLAEHVVTCWSGSCLCDLHPDYLPINKWNHGAANIELSQDGAFEVDNYRIINGAKWK